MEGGDERSEAIQKRKNALRMGIGELRENHSLQQNVFSVTKKFATKSPVFRH